MQPILPFKESPALIGMVHLRALPGAPRYANDLDAVVAQAVAEATTLAEAGFTAIMVENFHDAPFFKTDLPPITIAALTRCAIAIRQAVPDVELGINALRNDGLTALSIAVAVGARFIRVNVLCGAMVTDQGIIEGCAAELLRARRDYGANVAILADVAVKHASPLAAYDAAQSAQDLVIRGGADALIVSGTGTGQPTTPADVQAVQAAVKVPVFVGSGTTADNLPTLGAHGYIVGTALKTNGLVCPIRAKAIYQAACLQR